jgi:uncharacterized protein (DUF58 family)
MQENPKFHFLNFSFLCGIMDTADLLKKVREVEIITRRLSKLLFMGGYHSAFKGRGMSFSEVRNYQYGDDVRNIDWNVTARTGEAFVKIFEEERELSVMLLADVSASSFFGSGVGPDKKDFITELCAVLAFSASSNHDKTGLLLFSDQTELYLNPTQGRAHNLRMIRELLNVAPKSTRTDLEAACVFTRNVLKKRSICFIVSDFYSSTNYELALSVLGRRHDCIGIHVWDAAERQLPDLGIVEVLDPETGTLYATDTAHPDVRRQYTTRFDAHRQRVQTIFQNAGCDLISLRTDQDYTPELIRLFDKRNR